MHRSIPISIRASFSQSANRNHQIWYMIKNFFCMFNHLTGILRKHGLPFLFFFIFIHNFTFLNEIAKKKKLK